MNNKQLISLTLVLSFSSIALLQKSMMAGQHPDGDFAYKLREGRGPMTRWKNTLSNTQVWHLVNFIQSLEGKPDDPKMNHSATM